MAAVYIPHMVKHVTMAVLRERAVRSFPDALQLARHHLTKHGYLTPGSEKGEMSNIRLTPKGRKREREHKRKPAHVRRAFDKLYEKHELKQAPGKPDKESEKLPGGGRE